MKQSSLPITEVDVRGHLATLNGVPMSCDGLARHFKISARAMRFTLNGLVQSGIIKKSNGRAPVYFVPTAEQTAKLQELTTMRAMTPLKIDRARQELHDRIRAEREQVKSIG